MELMKKIFTIMLCVFMVLVLLPFDVYANDENTDETQEVQAVVRSTEVIEISEEVASTTFEMLINGNEITPNTIVGNGDNITLKVNWDFKETESTRPSETQLNYTYTLPEELNVNIDKEIKGQGFDDANQQMFEYTILNRTVNLTFNENWVKTHKNDINANINITITPHFESEDTEYVWKYKIPGTDQEVEVKYNNDDIVEQHIKKFQLPCDDNGVITYRVDYKALKDLTNVTFEDTLEKGLVYNDPIDVTFNGSPVNVTINDDGKGFTFTQDVVTRGNYIITYKAKAISPYSNKVKGKDYLDNTKNTIKATANKRSVENTSEEIRIDSALKKDAKHIEKDGKSYTQWFVDLNNNAPYFYRLDLRNFVVNDNMNGATIVGNVEVYKKTSPNEDFKKAFDLPGFDGKTEFSYTFNDVEDRNIYRFRYLTKGNGDPITNNYATISYADSDEFLKASKEFENGGYEKNISKEIVSKDLDQKEANYKITIHWPDQSCEYIEVLDRIFYNELSGRPNSNQFTHGSVQDIAVYQMIQGQRKDLTNIYRYDQGATTFTINIPKDAVEDFNEPIYLEYKDYMEEANLPGHYKNEARLRYMLNGEYKSEIEEKEFTVEQTNFINKYTDESDHKVVDNFYDMGPCYETYWSLTVNTNEEDIRNITGGKDFTNKTVTVVDKMPKMMHVVDRRNDYVNVSTIRNNRVEQLEKGKDFTMEIDETSDPNFNILTFTFTNLGKQVATIRYKTYVKIEDINSGETMDLANEVEMFEDQTSIGKDSKSVQVTNEPLKKEGREDRSTGYINYTLKVNQSGSKLLGNDGNLEVIDILDANTQLVPDTVKCVGKDGQEIKMKTAVEMIETEQGRTNQITFTVPDETALTIQYSTAVNSESENWISLKNIAYIKGVEATRVTNERQYYVYTASAGGHGKAGTLIVNKRDASDNSKVLPGAKFSLVKYTYKNGRFVKANEMEQTTNVDGNAIFGEQTSLQSNTLYVLNETEAPIGYEKTNETYYLIHKGNDEATYNKLCAACKKQFGENLTIYGNSSTIYVTNRVSLDYKVRKVFDDAGFEKIRPDSLKVVLQKKVNWDYETVAEVNIPINTKENTFEHVFKGLESMDSNGNMIEYRVYEEDDWAHEGDGVPTKKDNSCYLPQYTVTAEGTEITNTLYTSIPVTKKWVGPRTRQVTVNLLRNNKDTGRSIVLNNSNHWKGEFEDIKASEIDQYSVEEIRNEDYISKVTGNARDGFKITNTRQWPVHFHKYDEESYYYFEQLEGAELELSSLNDKSFGPMEIMPGEIVNLVPNTYVLKETKTPSGYKTADPVKFEVLDDGSVVSRNKNTGFSWSNDVNYGSKWHLYSRNDSDTDEDDRNGLGTVIMIDKPEQISLKVTKEWDDFKNQDGKRPQSIEVTLNKNGSYYKKATLDDSNKWTYTFKDLDAYQRGQKVDWSVTEESVEHYTSNTILVSDEKNVKEYKFTNSYTPKKRSITVTKEWDDDSNRDGVRPNEIKVQLLKNGKEYKKPVSLKKGQWTHTWNDLPMYDQGKLVDYTVKEASKIDGYTCKEVKGSMKDGFRVINSHTTKKIDITGKKTWKDDNSKDRPTHATMELYADDVKIQQTQTNKNDTYSFINLPKYKDGKEIVYTVKEVEKDGYKSIKDGYNFTNVRVGKTSIDVSKVWNDDLDTHPSITVDLLANNKVTKSIELTSDMDWKYTFNDLDAYDEEGKKITYSVKEQPVKDYASMITGSEEEGFLITNRNISKRIIPVKKTWQDELTKHDPIEIEIYDVTNATEDTYWDKPVQRNGKKYTITLSDENNWTNEFVDLDNYDENGKYKIYGIHEEPVEGYWNPVYQETTIDGKPAMEIVNTINGYLLFTMKKEWLGPKKETTLILHGTSGEIQSDGKYEVDFEERYVLDAHNNYTIDAWVYKYDYLGREITYTLSEENIENYELVDIKSEKNAEKIDGKSIKLVDDDTVTFVNKNTETVKVPVKKVWKDNNADHTNDEVTVTVVQQGKHSTKDNKSLTLNAANNWQDEFSDLPKYDQDGQEIKYAIKEIEQPGYNTSVVGSMKDGYTITNTKEGKVTLGVTKKWIGEPIKDKDFEVQLYRNIKGEEPSKVEGKTVTLHDGNWSDNFEELEENDAEGRPYIYSVKEVTTPEDGEHWEYVNITYYGNTIVVTNRNTETTHLTVKKVWKDPEGTQHEDIQVQLLKDGNPVEGKIVTLSNDSWEYTFEDLPVYDITHGNKITYSARELEVPKYYEGKADLKDNEVTITNVRTEQMDIKVNKVWVGPKQKEVKVKLQRKKDDGSFEDVLDPEDGFNTKVVTLNHINGWLGKFEELEKYDENGQVIEYNVEELDVPENYEPKVTGDSMSGFVVTNTNNETVSIPVTKKWVGKESTATFELYKDGSKVDGQELTLTTGSDSFKDLPKYNEDGTEIDYTVKEKPMDGYRVASKVEDGTWTFTNFETTSIEVTKKWDGPEDTATIQLFKDGEETGKTVTLSKTNNYKASFDDLDLLKEDGSKIEYTIKEVNNPKYETKIEGNASDGFVVTNTWLCPLKINKFENLETKNLEGVKLNLYKGFKENKKLYKEDIKTGSLYMVPKGDYTLVEVECPEGYEKAADIEFTINGKDGIVIKNTFAIDDEGNVSSGDQPVGYAYQFNHNGSTSGDGFNVERLSVKNVMDQCSKPRWKNEQGGDLYLKTMQYKSILQVMKFGYPSDAGYIQELNDLTDDEFKEVTQDALWYYTSSYNVQKEKIDQNKYSLNQREAFNSLTSTPNDINQYYNAFVYSNDDGSKFISTSVTEVKSLTMFDAAKEIEIHGSKVWEDDNNRDGKRPESITVNLLADGRKVQSKDVVVDETGAWNFTFDKVPGYKNGERIDYKVTEDSIPNYKGNTENKGNNEFVVTNTYTPKKTTLNVKKVWDDNNDQDGKRPSEITVYLVEDGVKNEEKTLTLNKANGYTGSFDDLYMFKDGKKIVYTVEEEPVDDYETTINGDAKTGYTIINKHTPETRVIEIEKKWEDENNQDRIQPLELSFSFNEKPIDSFDESTEWPTTDHLKLSGNGNTWTGSKTVPVYKNGHKITYDIIEATVDGYEVFVEKYDKDGKNTEDLQTTYKWVFKNTHEVQTTSIKVKKEWTDHKLLFDKHPEVKAQLYRTVKDSKEEPEKVLHKDDSDYYKVLSKDSEWEATFDCLPKYNEEKEEYIYSVKEIDVDPAYRVKSTEFNEEDGVWVITNEPKPVTPSEDPIIPHWPIDPEETTPPGIETPDSSIETPDVPSETPSVPTDGTNDPSKPSDKKDGQSVPNTSDAINMKWNYFMFMMSMVTAAGASIVLKKDESN